jgi:hypothetical protein
MGFLDATNTCTTLELSSQSINKDIPSFFTRFPRVPLSALRIAWIPHRNALCSIFPFPHSLALPLSRVPWVARNVQRFTKSHVCCVCFYYSVG